ncbi:hypothetical protein GH714_004668 [Hevea brasiliensis]|uniref:Cytochrome P450 n=1 Tax=Hevea brasiliensis TaxID=3981 RepID=A0A6A6LJN8_HEVBR|nr:hypothetical protein GH714_004668 [Hevea brasiliensis]
MLQTRKQHKNLPPSPPSLPIIGHLHLLKQPIHQSLNNLPQKYGPITYLRLGLRPALVVSSPSAVEECLTKNDVVFANRPDFYAGKRYYGEEVKESCKKQASNFREIMEELFAYTGSAILRDLFPILQWIDYDGIIKKLVRLGEKIDSILQELIEEHRIDKDRNTMINHLLALQESQPQ